MSVRSETSGQRPVLERQSFHAAELGGVVRDEPELAEDRGNGVNVAPKAEHDAYVKLAQEHRELAARLQSTANRMASYRDLPMGSHDPVAMSAPKVAEAFETFVRVKRELATLLQRSAFQDEKMLVQMRAASRR